MDLTKLYHPTRFNSWQFIAFVGLLMSGGADAADSLRGAPAPTPRLRLALRVLGGAIRGWARLVNLRSKPTPPGHHHHH